MKSPSYIIRAHHGMCLQFFKGKGYSKEFAERMYELSEGLKKDPLIKITDNEDYLCEVCPNRKALKPDAEDKADLYDKKVLEKCDIKAGTVMPYSVFKKAVFDNILNRKERETICGDCQWSKLCHFEKE